MEKIVLEVDEDLKGLELPLRALFAEAERRLIDARQGRRVDYELFEQRLVQRLGDVERRVHAATLGALDVDAEHVLINGKPHARVGRNPAEYKAQAGPVVVTRSLYRPLGERNAPTVDLVTLRSGAIADGWLPGTARAMAHLLQQGTSREAKQTADRLGRLPYSRSSFERVGHEVGELFAEKHVPIEETLIRTYEVPKEAGSVSVSLDRVSLPMEEPKPRGPGRPKKGAPKRSIQRVFRMAYCGTVTLHDENGEALHTLRYGCMPGADEKALVTSMASDVLALQRKQPTLAVMALADGSPENWGLLGNALDQQSFGQVHRLIDFWHVLEKLAAAAKVVHGEQESSGVVRRWKLRLFKSNSATTEILEELAASGKEHIRVGNDQPVHEAMTYLKNNATRMKYATARYLGLPIGSGAVEATCKSLVGVRMKRPGSRWKHTTGEHVIQLRALSLSDRWDQAMDLTLRPQPIFARAA